MGHPPQLSAFSVCFSVRLSRVQDNLSPCLVLPSKAPYLGKQRLGGRVEGRRGGGIGGGGGGGGGGGRGGKERGGRGGEEGKKE